MGFWSIFAICWAVMVVSCQLRAMFARWCEAREKTLPRIGDRLTRLEALDEGARLWSRMVGEQLRDLQKRVNELEREEVRPEPLPRPKVPGPKPVA